MYIRRSGNVQDVSCTHDVVSTSYVYWDVQFTSCAKDIMPLVGRVRGLDSQEDFVFSDVFFLTFKIETDTSLLMFSLSGIIRNHREMLINTTYANNHNAVAYKRHFSKTKDQP